MNEENVFLLAIEIDGAPERAAFLDEVCGGDRALRAGVESLLRHHFGAGSFLESPPVQLQQTFADFTGETVKDALSDRSMELLLPSCSPGSIGRLGSYEVLSVIGRGGMGTVFRAHDPMLRRDVAIKVMSPGAQSPLAARRFVREAQAAAAVKHEHVITIYAVCDDGDQTPYLVMELVEGESLQDRIERQGALEPGEILRIGAQIAEGLGAAHGRGLVHRDIKPANILLEAGTERVKITDFGLARAVDDADLSHVGQIAGTPQFMSPEQALGRPADHRSDLFSLGNVLYTMCTGLPAFSADSAMATLRGICDDLPPRASTRNPAVPSWLNDLILGLLEKSPARRPQSAREVADLLARHAAGRQPAIPAWEAGGARRAAGADKRAPRIRAALTAAAVLALAAVVLVIVRQDGAEVRVEVPDGSSVRVTAGGDVELDLPGSRPSGDLPVEAVEVPEGVRRAADRLVELNPRFDGVIASTVLNDEVIELRFNADHVKDLSPLRELTTVRRLVCAGSAAQRSRLTDLSPLQGLSLQSLDVAHTAVQDLAPLAGMPLERVNLHATPVADLAPLQGLPLKFLDCSETEVASLVPLAGLPLEELYIQGTPVADLSSLRGMPLAHLNCSLTPVTDLSPLEGLPLISLYFDATHVEDLSVLQGLPLKHLNWRGYDQTDARYEPVVRSIASLEEIDSLPAAEFWRRLDAARRTE